VKGKILKLRNKIVVPVEESGYTYRVIIVKSDDRNILRGAISYINIIELENAEEVIL
jgi:hypothetical protein